LGVGALAVVAWVFGSPIQHLGQWFGKAWDWACAKAWSLVPKTALSAGITAIVAAFAVLGLGAVVSLRRRAPAPPAEAAKVESAVGSSAGAEEDAAGKPTG
jgi:MYXO-CTERM domain-containing protein